MKIIFYNIAYGTGLNGSWRQYFLKIRRFVWLPFFHTRKIAKLLKKHRADVLCLVEVDGGSYRNRFMCQTKRLAKKLDFNFWHTKSKYHPKSLFNYLPYIRKRNDAIISSKNGEVHCHYIKSGMKTLVQEFIVNNISIFTVHLAVLQSKIRKMQLEELNDILKKCRHPFILCGDFNIQNGLKEIKDFSEKTGLQLVELPATWPSCKPKKYFDLFFTSSGIKIEDAGIIESELSDHLPIWIKIDY